MFLSHRPDLRIEIHAPCNGDLRPRIRLGSSTANRRWKNGLEHPDRDAERFAERSTAVANTQEPESWHAVCEDEAESAKAIRANRGGCAPGEGRE